MRKFLAVTAALLIVFSAVLSLSAWGGSGECGKKGMGKGMGMGPMGDNEFMPGPKMILAMASELNLTAEQMEKLKKIGDACAQKGQMRDEMKKDRDAVEAELKKDKPDMAKIDSMIDASAKKKAERMKQMVRVKAEVDSVLTKEQKEILKKKMDDKKDWKKGKKNK